MYRAAAVALAWVLAGFAAQGFRLYQVIDLGALGGTNSYARDVNNRVEVVGWAENSLGHQRPFLWKNGVMHDIGTFPDSTNGWAYAINDLGQICGASETGGTYYYEAFLYTDGVMSNLGTLGGVQSAATAINGRGQMAGWAMVPDNRMQASLFRDGTIVRLHDMQYGNLWSSAWGVNMATQVVGRSQKYDPINKWYPFLWYDANGNQTNDWNEMIELRNLTATGYFGGAWSVNNGGQVVGAADVASYPSVTHPFLVTPRNGSWFTDTNADTVNDLMIDLGTLGGTLAEALDINDAGDVVGYSTTAGTEGTNAFLWEDGVLTNLNELIPPGCGWTLERATAINEEGDIVGVGTVTGKWHAFLLTTDLRILRTPLVGQVTEIVYTNESMEVETQKLVQAAGMAVHWTLGWTVLDTQSVYTVEAYNPSLDTHWSPVPPTGQWPIAGTVWTNIFALHGTNRWLRVRGETPAP